VRFAMIQYSGTVQRDGIGALPLQRGWHGWLVEWATVGMETGEGKGG